MVGGGCELTFSMKQVLGALTPPGPVVFPASSSFSSGMHVVCSCARFCGQVPHICTRQVRLRAHHVTARSWITLKTEGFRYLACGLEDGPG